MSEETIIERLTIKVKEVTKSIRIWMDALDNGEVTQEQFDRELSRLKVQAGVLMEIWTGEKEDYAEIL